ncbi:MAG TPA: class I SAM-dependent methyltransferase [Hyphomicrobiaceae bacterium]|nr:class I SAM-dependent methyltransferase [Hyphomicrobiaceae bacterium]
MHITTADERFWNRTARKYAADPIKDMAGYERTLCRTRELLGPTSTVLEIGCGTGSTALLLASSVGQIEASDISSEMIAIAGEKARAAGCCNVSFSVASADGATVLEGAYDAILAFNILHLVADRRAVLASVRRQLKPGGLLISKTPCLSEMNSLIRLAVPVARLFGKAPSVAFFPGEQLEAEIAASGFTIIERARHGSGRRDPRLFVVARKVET